MEAFTTHRGLVAPLDRDNVDTDAVIPKQFCKSVSRNGFGAHLFDAWRFHDAGELGIDPAIRCPRAEFVLNRPEYRGATILVAGNNFGCGSSREHAVWALQQFGFRAVIAPSFADIFRNNCAKIGLLTVVLPQKDIDHLIARAEELPSSEVVVDLETQTVSSADGSFTRQFEIDPFVKHCLLEGLDDIGLTLLEAEAIDRFEAARPEILPRTPAGV